MRQEFCCWTSQELASIRREVAWLAETLRRMRDAGCTMLMSLHGESEISALATRAIRLDAGAIVADTQAGASVRSILAFADA